MGLEPNVISQNQVGNGVSTFQPKAVPADVPLHNQRLQSTPDKHVELVWCLDATLFAPSEENERFGITSSQQ